MSDTTLTVLIIAIVAIVIAAGWYYMRTRTRRLQSRFGPEYDRAVEQAGTTRRAESMLSQRERRVAKYSLRSLSFGERERFIRTWHAIQERFVDDPRRAIAEADDAVNQAMIARGYPMGDFEQKADDLSVDYPQEVQNYRTAHAIADRSNRNAATTEDLRVAMQRYRALFESVLETNLAESEEVRR